MGEAAVDEVERVLAEIVRHWPVDALTCYDHVPTSGRGCWCCKCGAHDLTIGWPRHVAGHIADLSTTPESPRP